MASVFPNIEIEEKVQINDRTRLSAEKSFVTTGATAITTLTVKPNSEESAISVFNSDPAYWYLDWEHSAWEADIDSSNNKIDFNEGGSALVATLTSGTYTLAELLAEVKTQLESAGAGTYTLSADADNKITVSSTANFELMPKTGSNRHSGILNVLGFFKDTGLSTSVTGKAVEYLPRRITVSASNGTQSGEVTVTQKVYSVNGDKLFSSDAELRIHEADILKYVPPGRNTFKDVHRRAQEKILAWLDKEGYVDVYGEKYTKAAIVDIDEVKEWSTYLALRLISEGISTGEEDVWSGKAKMYKGYEVEARNRAVLRIDIDQDGDVELDESVRISTGEIYRR